MKLKDLLVAILLGTGGGNLLLSIALYMLFWRIDNEPGAASVPALLWGAILFCSTGGLAFVGCNIFLVVRRAWAALIVGWGICMFYGVVALGVSPFLLLLMV